MVNVILQMVINGALHHRDLKKGLKEFDREICRIRNKYLFLQSNMRIDNKPEG